jgi:hypothetical protein
MTFAPHADHLYWARGKCVMGACLCVGSLKVDARLEEDKREADAERYAKLMGTIAGLDAPPHTAISDAVAAQRPRVTEELRQVALRRQAFGFDEALGASGYASIGQGDQYAVSKYGNHKVDMICRVSDGATRGIDARAWESLPFAVREACIADFFAARRDERENP